MNRSINSSMKKTIKVSFNRSDQDFLNYKDNLCREGATCYKDLSKEQKNKLTALFLATKDRDEWADITYDPDGWEIDSIYLSVIKVMNGDISAERFTEALTSCYRHCYSRCIQRDFDRYCACFEPYSSKEDSEYDFSDWREQASEDAGVRMIGEI